MNYTAIKESAQAYTDRYDEELVDSLPAFTRIVESKINMALKVGDQSIRAQIPLYSNKEYYPLPCDFGGMRDIEVLKNGDFVGGTTLIYLSPEEMNKVSRKKDGRPHNYYTIIGNQIQICGATDDHILEIVYYQLVPPLQEPEDTNWLSEQHPQAYVFGMAAEICAYAKDAVGFQTYDGRFKETLFEITQEDQVSRWSGPALRVQLDALVV